MTMFELIARLIVAVNINDLQATARLLAELESRLSPEELLPILEAVLGEEPASARSAAPSEVPVRCA